MQSNDKVMVYLEGKWHNCVVIRSKPWKYGIEWQYLFDPVPVENKITRIYPSTGGYADEKYFKLRSCICPAKHAPQGQNCPHCGMEVS